MVTKPKLRVTHVQMPSVLTSLSLSSGKLLYPCGLKSHLYASQTHIPNLQPPHLRKWMTIYQYLLTLFTSPWKCKSRLPLGSLTPPFLPVYIATFLSLSSLTKMTVTASSGCSYPFSLFCKPLPAMQGDPSTL